MTDLGTVACVTELETTANSIHGNKDLRAPFTAHRLIRLELCFMSLSGTVCHLIISFQVMFTPLISICGTNVAQCIVKTGPCKFIVCKIRKERKERIQNQATGALNQNFFPISSFRTETVF